MPTDPNYRVYKSDADKARIYNHRLGIADTQHDKWEPQAQDWYSRYENIAKRNQHTPKGHRVNVGTGVATIDALFSALTAVEVDTYVQNRGAGSPELAELASAALTQEWSTLHVTDETADTIKDALIVGIGWVKVAYEYVTTIENIARPREDIRAEVVQLIEQAEAAGEQAPSPEQIGTMVPLTEDQEVTLRDRIVVDYVPWDMVRFDPTAKRPRDIRWVAQYTKMTLPEVQRNPAFREYCARSRGGLKLLDDLKADSTIEKEFLVGGKAEDDDGRVTVVEFTDLDSGTVCTFVKGAKWLLYESVNPFALNLDRLDRSPFVPLVLRASTRRVRGVGDMELITPTLDELNVYRSKLANYVERFVPKIAGPEDGLTPEGLEALQSPEFGEYVSIARESDPKAITPLNPPVLPSEVFNLPQTLVDAIYEMTGANELMRGLFPDRKRTATETAEVVSASAARQAEKRNTLEAFYRAISRRILQLMQQFYTQERVLRFVDPMFGEVEWEWTADDIIFEYDLDIQLTPKTGRTRQTEKDDAIAELNLLGPFAMPGPDGSSTVDVVGLLKRFCRKMGMTNAEILEVLNLPEEQQAQKLARQQDIAGQAQAAQGFPNPGMAAGPLDADQLAAYTNQGAVPDEIAASAVAGGAGPFGPQAVEQVSESAGVRSR